jgi:hypothetical protein
MPFELASPDRASTSRRRERNDSGIQLRNLVPPNNSLMLTRLAGGIGIGALPAACSAREWSKA